MNNTDNLYKVSEIKNQFDKLQKKYQTHLPKIDPYLVYAATTAAEYSQDSKTMLEIDLRAAVTYRQFYLQLPLNLSLSH
jgi:hypothetical protein